MGKDEYEELYQIWKNSCKKNIEDFHKSLGIPKLDLVEFAYKYYPEDFKNTEPWIERVYKELKVEYA